MGKNCKMNLKQHKKKIIHTRQIEISTYTCDEKSLIVEGVLKDDRMIPYHTISDEIKPAGTIHHIIIRMRIDTGSLVIKEIEAEMPTIPREECPETMKALEKIRGMKIRPGFTSKVKKMIGGNRGCVHLATLLMAMAPASFQGNRTHQASRPFDKKEISRDMLETYLIDSCMLWRKGGPLANQFLQKGGDSED